MPTTVKVPAPRLVRPARFTKDEIRFELAKRSFIDFLDYVYLTEPRPDGTNSRIKFELWPHLIDAAQHLLIDKRIIVPKPRQIGWTWLLAAYVVWKVAYNQNFKVLLLSQGQDEAYDFLGKCEYIRLNLPPELQPRRINDARNSIELGKEWWVRALPSTAKAGHGTTAGLVIFDEADFHEYLESAYAAVDPTIRDVGGQLIMVSKCDARTPQSLFKRLVRGAPLNGFTCLFYPWNVRVNRTQEWYDEGLKAAADPFDYAKSYPATLEEALAAPKEMQVIGKELYDTYVAETRAPISVQASTKVWQRYVPGRRYIAASDISHGVGLDKSVTVLVDIASGLVVADVVSRTTDPLQFTVDSFALLRAYQSPVWVIEDNDWGMRVIDRANALNYPRLYQREAGKFGWRTHDSTRPILWGNLLDALFHRTILLPNIEGVEEMAWLIRNPGRGGRIEAAAGGTDDYMVAVGIALSCREYAVQGTASYEPPGARPDAGIYKWGRGRGTARRGARI